jgi:hypothetical protein
MIVTTVAAGTALSEDGGTYPEVDYRSGDVEWSVREDIGGDRVDKVVVEKGLDQI